MRSRSELRGLGRIQIGEQGAQAADRSSSSASRSSSSFETRGSRPRSAGKTPAAARSGSSATASSRSSPRRLAASAPSSSPPRRPSRSRSTSRPVLGELATRAEDALDLGDVAGSRVGRARREARRDRVDHRRRPSRTRPAAARARARARPPAPGRRGARSAVALDDLGPGQRLAPRRRLLGALVDEQHDQLGPSGRGSAGERAEQRRPPGARLPPSPGPLAQGEWRRAGRPPEPGRRSTVGRDTRRLGSTGVRSSKAARSSVGGSPVDAVHVDECAVALAAPRGTRGPADLVAGSKLAAADLGRRDVDVAGCASCPPLEPQEPVPLAA